MPEIIAPQSWQTRATLRHARALLGKFLVRAGHAPHMITEVEAYDGERDLACHARAGRTRRTEVLYATGGVWYVYLCYGIHEMLNLVVGPKDWPAAILIRGLDGVSGPGRVTRKLGINRTLNGKTASVGELWIEDHGVRVPPRIIKSGPRVGVDFAGPVWAAKPWRFHFDPDELPRAPKVHAPQPRTIANERESRTRKQ
jgi:DNA-3-methyladenine glycosylase